MKRAYTEIHETGGLSGISPQECVEARQQIENLVGLERFYAIEEETVEKTRHVKL